MKKGFTLIELLAVIVILAIIALIAAPIVLNIIKDSKESATLRSADFYLDGVELSVSEAMLDNKKIENGTYPITEDGDICIGILDGKTCNKLENDEESGYVLEVVIKGEKPTGGTITIINVQIGDIYLIFGDKVIVKNDNDELVFDEPKEEKLTLANYIKNLYSETKTTIVNGIEYSLDETHSLMNDRLASSEVGKTDGNIRYYGANPNNYIDIGDRDSNGNIIFWRIIGVFKDVEVTDENDNVVKTEDLVKIIRADKLTAVSWDYTLLWLNDDGSYGCSTSNKWKDSTLQMMLNDEVNGYYGSGTTSYYNNSTKPTTLNFKSTGLSDAVHSKIERVNWSLGICNDVIVYTDIMYGYERAGTNIWSGKIALMNPSDYGYSADLSSCQSKLSSYYIETCKTTNWMYDSTKMQWSLISSSSDLDDVIFVSKSGFISYRSASYDYSVRPVLYLNSNVGIVEEKETSEGLKYLVVE